MDKDHGNVADPAGVGGNDESTVTEWESDDATFVGDAELSEEEVADEVEGAVVDAPLPSTEMVNIDHVDLNDMAKLLIDDESTDCLTTEKRNLVMSSTVNTKRYTKNKKGIEQRFFDTIVKFGGAQLSQLALFSEDGFKPERVLYIKLRGEKNTSKHFILNKCLVKIALKWRNNDKKSKNYGKHLQPSTWDTMLKNLFAVFRQKNIVYNHVTDFNGDGEFHSVLTTMWAQEQEVDKTFATGVGISTFDENADLKIRNQYREGKFNPMTSEVTEKAYDDRLKYMIFVLGRYFLCRGRTEIAFSLWRNVKLVEVVVDDGTKDEYVEYHHNWNKSHKCKLKNTTKRSSVPPRVYANVNDELCPYKSVKLMRSLCAETQQRILCQAATSKVLKKFQREGKLYIYNENLVVGANTVGPLCKKMAAEMVFEDWEKCTGHRYRKQGITTAMSHGDKNIAPLILRNVETQELSNVTTVPETN
jgi:hypothetical protein